MQDVKKYKGSYSILAVVAMLYLASSYNLRNNPMFVLYLTLAFGLFYFVWGIVHHLTTKSLNSRVMLEYFLVTALGIVIMSTLLL